MMQRGHRVFAAATVSAAALLLASCGSQLSQQQLAAGAGGSSPVPVGGSQGGTDTGTALGSTGGSAPGTGGGSVSGTGGTGSTPRGGAGGNSTSGGGGSSTSGAGGNRTGGARAGSPGGGHASSGGHSSNGPTTNGAKTDGQAITICGADELSGPAGAAVKQGASAVKAWAADVNSRGGVAGHHINVVIKDSQSDPSTARSEAQSCIADDHAVAFVDELMPLTLPSVEPVLQAAKVPAVGGDCGNDGWNKFAILWNECMSLESTEWATALEAAKNPSGNKNFGFLYCAEAAVCQDSKKLMLDEHYATRNGLTVAYQKQTSLTQLDFTSECAAMKRAHVGVVTMSADPASYQRLGQSCAREGYYPWYAIGEAEASAVSNTYPGLKNIQLILTSFPFAAVPGGIENTFAKVWSRYGDGTPAGPSATNGYASCLMFQYLVEQAARTDAHVTAASLLKVEGAVRLNTFGGALPPTTLRPGKPTPDSACWFLLQATGGGAWRAPRGSALRCRK